MNNENTETLSNLFQDLAKYFELQLDTRIKSALLHFDNSYMSFYEIINLKKNIFELKELISNEKFKCTITSGYNKKDHKYLFARVLPNLIDRNSESILLSTPYVIVKNKEKDWLDFFERQGISSEDEDYLEKYKHYMKFGPNQNYWHEYITDAYLNFQTEAIFLTGIPDIKGSKPHEME